MSELTILKVEKNDVLDVTVNIYGTKENPMFNAGEVALLLWASKEKAGKKYPMMNKLRKALNITESTLASTNFITEKQYYKAILKSNSPVAEPMYDWLSDEVLPALRKDGVFITDTKLDEALAECKKSLGKKNAPLKLKLDAIFDIYGNDKAHVAAESILKVVAKKQVDKEITYKALRGYIQKRRLDNAAALIEDTTMLHSYSVAIKNILIAQSSFRKGLATRTETKLKAVEAKLANVKTSTVVDESVADALTSEIKDLESKVKALKVENAELKEFDPRTVKFFIDPQSPDASIKEAVDKITEDPKNTVLFATTVELNPFRGKDRDATVLKRPHLSGIYVTEEGRTVEAAIWHNNGYKYMSLSGIGLQGGMQIIIKFDLLEDDYNEGHFIGCNGGVNYFGTFEALTGALVVYKNI